MWEGLTQTFYNESIFRWYAKDDGGGCQTGMGRSSSRMSGSGILELDGQVMVGISTAEEAETVALGQVGEGRPKYTTHYS